LQKGFNKKDKISEKPSYNEQDMTFKDDLSENDSNGV
jgi:hypothetical protein